MHNDIESLPNLGSEVEKDASRRIIVPLDVPTEEQALSLVAQLREYVGLFKIGLELITSVGLDIVRKVREIGGEVFYDGKFNDIPNTVAGAARAATKLGVQMFNVHATSGSAAMKAALEASKNEAQIMGIKKPIILGVTLLTSIDKLIMNKELQIKGAVVNQVVHLAKLIDEVGLDGVIASPQEIKDIRQKVSERLLIVTPGVRPTWAASQDQKRVMTPSEAIAQGASYLVIGRPITQPPREIGGPVEATKRIVEEIDAASRKLKRQVC
jgi:orotidine-5'-phosphate decarboxylase